MRKWLMVGVGIVIVIAAMPVWADGLSRDDPDDAGHQLDVAETSHGHLKVRGGRFLTHRISTFEAWENSVLEGSSLRIFFNLDRDPETERTLLVTLNEDGSLNAEMHGNGKLRGYARAWRPDDRTVKVAFPPSLLRRGLEVYRWRVETVGPGFPEQKCSPDPDQPCLDLVPDRGFIRHKL